MYTNTMDHTDIQHLLEDDLTYELSVRGLPTSGSLVDRQNLLVGILTTSLKDTFPAKPSKPEDDKSEYLVCKGKLLLLAGNVQSSLISSSNTLVSLKVRMECLHGRISRLTDVEMRAQLLLVWAQIMGDLAVKWSVPKTRTEDLITFGLAKPVVTEEEHNLPRAESTFIDRLLQLETPAVPVAPASAPIANEPLWQRRDSSMSIPCGTPLLQPSANPIAEPTAVFNKNLQVSRWKISYNGVGSVNSFLERVEEKAASYGVSHDQLFRQAGELFLDQALVWFRFVKHEVRSWPELVKRLKSAFLPTDYEYELWDEIRARTQGPDEKVEIFVAVMQNLMSRFVEPVPDAAKLQVILRNLQPKFQSEMLVRQCSTVSQLIATCKNIEDSAHRIATFKNPPSRTSNLLEPELAYRRERHVVHQAETVTRTKSVCWNCNSPNHLSAACPNKMGKHCFSCGKPGVIRPSCPNCKHKSKKREGCDRNVNRRVVSPPLKVDRRELAEWMNKIAKFSQKSEISPVWCSQDADPRPFLNVKIGKSNVIALVDTGATVSVIGKRGLHLLQEALNPIRKVNREVYTADGATQSVLGSVELPVCLNGNCKDISVLVVPSMRHPLVLGVDFCRAFELQLNFALDEWHSKPVEVAAVNSITGLDSLAPSSLKQLQPIVDAYKLLGSRGLGRTDLVTHIIDTGDALPVKQRYYPISPAMQIHLNREIDRMLELGVIRESSSPWSSPVLLVPKSSGEYRVCFDGRKLNSVTKKDAYPLPYISTILDKLRDAKYLSSIDLKNAFWQVPLDESSCAKTAFTVPGRGLFEFTRLPFGISNAPSTLQRLMDRVLGPGLESRVFVYLDDIVIVNSTFAEHLDTLNEVLNRLTAAGLTVNAEKCQFCRNSLKFLGFIVDQHGLRTDPSKVEAIVKYPRPTTATEIKRFMGTASWYRRFVPNFSSIADPINQLLKGKKKRAPIVWTKEAEDSFLLLKDALSSAPVLASPDFSKPFCIQTDASNHGLGAVLTQGEGEDEHAIAYVSRTLNKAERNYSVTERECLAVVFAIEKFRPYVEGTHFSVITDHFSLLWLMRMKDPNGKLARWAVKLQQFDFSLIHRPGRSNVVPDALSRASLEIAAINSFPNITDRWYIKLRTEILSSPAQFPDWRVEKDMIYKLLATGQMLPSNLSEWKLVVPREYHRQILQQCHDSPLSAHFGFLKTLNRVLEYYYWPRMRASVLKYVTRCTVCLEQKVSQFAPLGLMGYAKVVSHPWQTIAIDLMGPFPRSTAGHTYILVVADWFSKFPLVFPLRQASVGKIVSIIENEVFLLFGVPQTVMVDNGTQFTSKQFRDLISRYQVPKLWFNAKYHPQVNFVERTNRVLKTAIRSFVHDNHRLWDANLPKIAQAIRTSVHEVTGYSPSFLTFGRHVPTSGSFYSVPPAAIVSDQPQGYANSLTALSEIFKDVETKLLRAHERNARHYNLRRRPLAFKEGDSVWKRNCVLSDASKYFSAKLTPRYIKCTVYKKISPLTYRLRDANNKDLGVWHIKDLKQDPDDDEAMDNP